MNNEFWLPVLTDGLFAAIAAIGFAVICSIFKSQDLVHIFTLCSFRNRDAKYVSRPPRPVSGGSIFFSGSTSHDPRYVCL